jgi:TolB-like protein
MLAAGFATQPVIVVYPLVASQGTPPSVGLAVSGVLSTTIASHGDVTVKGAPGDTQQADVLSTARKLGADYYITGFVTEIGSQVSAVEQLVGTKSGVIVWRTTASYAVPDDARVTGDQLRAAILQAENPGFTSMSGGGDSASAPAAPSAPRQGPAPKPVAPLPIPISYVPPMPPDTQASQTTGPRILVVDFDGTAMDAVKHYVPVSVLRTLPRYNMSGSSLDVTSGDVAAQGMVACAQSGSDFLMDGTISADQASPDYGWSFDANLKMNVYSCRDLRAKPLVIEKNVSNGNLQTAVDIVVDQALKDLAYAQKTATR